MNSIQTTDIFDAWFEALRAELGNMGDCQPIGEGVSEMRIHIGAGYRVYFKKVGNELIILLAGGNKSTQQADIKTALKLAQSLKG